MNASPSFWSFKNEYLSDDQQNRDGKDDDDDLSDVNNDEAPADHHRNQSDNSHDNSKN